MSWLCPWLWGGCSVGVLQWSVLSWGTGQTPWAGELTRPDPASVLGWDHPREDLGPWEYPRDIPVRLCPALQGLFPSDMGTVLHTPLLSSRLLILRRAGLSHFPQDGSATGQGQGWVLG